MPKIHRAFVDSAILQAAQPSQRLALPPQTLHRFYDVLRLKSGSSIALFDGSGRTIEGILEQKGIFCEQVVEASQVGSGRCILAQALAKGDKLDDVVRRATELGASQILLFESEHCVARPTQNFEEKLERLNRIAQDAARQSLRTDVPLVEGPLSFADLAGFVGAQADLCIVGELGSGIRLSQVLDEQTDLLQKRVMAVVGPEGGLSQAEIVALKEAGAKAVSWAPHVLRTETAGLAALAILQVYRKLA